jgi:hypothetical protein
MGSTGRTSRARVRTRPWRPWSALRVRSRSRSPSCSRPAATRSGHAPRPHRGEHVHAVSVPPLPRPDPGSEPGRLHTRPEPAGGPGSKQPSRAEPASTIGAGGFPRDRTDAGSCWPAVGQQGEIGGDANNQQGRTDQVTARDHGKSLLSLAARRAWSQVQVPLGSLLFASGSAGSRATIDAGRSALLRGQVVLCRYFRSKNSPVWRC